jgi:hypothetical protein
MKRGGAGWQRSLSSPNAPQLAGGFFTRLETDLPPYKVLRYLVLLGDLKVFDILLSSIMCIYMHCGACKAKTVLN